MSALWLFPCTPNSLVSPCAKNSIILFGTPLICNSLATANAQQYVPPAAAAEHVLLIVGHRTRTQLYPVPQQRHTGHVGAHGTAPKPLVLTGSADLYPLPDPQPGRLGQADGQLAEVAGIGGHHGRLGIDVERAGGINVPARPRLLGHCAGQGHRGGGAAKPQPRPGFHDQPDLDGVAAQRCGRRRHQVHGVRLGVPGRQGAAALDPRQPPGLGHHEDVGMHCVRPVGGRVIAHEPMTGLRTRPDPRSVRAGPSAGPPAPWRRRDASPQDRLRPAEPGRSC